MAEKRSKAIKMKLWLCADSNRENFLTGNKRKKVSVKAKAEEKLAVMVEIHVSIHIFSLQVV